MRMSSNNEVKFEIGDMAERLLFSVIDETTNKNSYPYKTRRLADRLQEYVLDIHSDLMDANGIRADTQKHKDSRYDLQTRAITTINKFLSLTKYSIYAGRISASKGGEWSSMATSIKYMTLSWRKS